MPNPFGKFYSLVSSLLSRPQRDIDRGMVQNEVKNAREAARARAFQDCERFISKTTTVPKNWGENIISFRHKAHTDPAPVFTRSQSFLR